MTIEFISGHIIDCDICRNVATAVEDHVKQYAGSHPAIGDAPESYQERIEEWWKRKHAAPTFWLDPGSYDHFVQYGPSDFDGVQIHRGGSA